MLRLNETILVDNPSLALEGECGVFELASPTGDILHIQCGPGRTSAFLGMLGFCPKKSGRTCGGRSKRSPSFPASQRRPALRQL